MTKPQQPDLKLLQTLFDADLHLGHKKNRLHPKARKFVYRIDNGVSIIDLTLTAEQFRAAKVILAQAKEEEKILLVVATKKVASQFVTDMCKQRGIAYITTKWLPGLLTNFDTLIKNVKKLNELAEQKSEGTWDQLTKHERGKLSKYLARLEKLYTGISLLKKKPDIMLIIDTKKEHNAVVEATSSQIPIVAVTDTNSNPFEVQYPIVANDDSPKSVEYLVNELINAYVSK